MNAVFGHKDRLIWKKKAQDKPAKKKTGPRQKKHDQSLTGLKRSKSRFFENFRFVNRKKGENKKKRIHRFYDHGYARLFATESKRGMRAERCRAAWSRLKVIERGRTEGGLLRTRGQRESARNKGK